MEDEEDDFYDPADTVAPQQAQNNTQNATLDPQVDDHMEDDEEEEESDEVRPPIALILLAAYGILANDVLG